MNENQKIRAFSEKLQKKQIVFFAGSGIGYDSGLVDIFDVLTRTEEVFLPTLNIRQKEIIGRIQPELFYSILLECSHNNNRCLDMWKCLNPQTWTPEYHPEPNFVHYFVAAYSYLADVPVFTVNYDTMFETACLKLGIDNYKVLLDPPIQGTEKSDHALKICKLHGDIGFNIHGDIDPAVFKTTMSEISKINQPWLEYISAFQQSKNFCFIGYSGRDIDYYPNMKKEFKKGKSPQPFWMMSQKSIDDKDETFLNADRIGNTIIINHYPNDIFPKIYDEVFEKTDFQFKMKKIYTAPLKKIEKSVKYQFLDMLMAKIPQVHIHTELFWIVFTQRINMINELRKSLDDFDTNIFTMDKWEKYLFLNAKIKCECVHAQFIKYRETAKELLALADSVKEKTPEDYRWIMDAKLHLISSYQMMIPAHLHFKIPLSYRKYCLALYVRFRFFLLNLEFKYLIKRKQRKFKEIDDMTITTVQEAKIRAYSMDVKINPKGCKRKLERLKKEAGERGNYTTFYGVDKYLNRLSTSRERIEDIERAVAMTHELSTESIAKRDLGDYRGALNIAIENDDTLSIIKNLLGMAYFQYEKEVFFDKNKPRLLSPNDEALLWEKAGEIESKSLSRAFAYIHRTYFIKQESC